MGVLIYQTVVRSAMGTLSKEAEVAEALEDRIGEPCGKRGGEKGVRGGEGGRPGLETAVGEMRPAGKGDGIDLRKKGQHCLIA